MLKINNFFKYFHSIFSHITTDKFYIEPNGKSEVFVIDRMTQETSVQGIFLANGFFLLSSDIITNYSRSSRLIKETTFLFTSQSKRIKYQTHTMYEKFVESSVQLI